jgi:hypothetical protein
MPKAIKGNAGRRPPEPSGSHSEIDGWAERQMPHLQPIVRSLDESIRAAIPGLQYAVKWKRPYYGLAELGWVIELAAYDVSVNVVFLGGADFDDPPPLGTKDRRSPAEGSRHRPVVAAVRREHPGALRFQAAGQDVVDPHQRELRRPGEAEAGPGHVLGRVHP